MAKIIIVGAGLTGLSTAYHLEKAGFFDYVVFEKEAHIGGLCHSLNHHGFTIDYTGHLLHISNPYTLKLLKKISNLDAWNTITRKSFVYSQNTYTQYPYQMNLFGLPTDTIIECIDGFLQRTTKGRQPKTFYQWVMHHFGAGFGNYFFFPYQRKIFDYDVKKLSCSWTNHFVPQTSLRTLITGTLVNNSDKPNVGYNAQFYYPKQGGIKTLIDSFARTIHNPIHTRVGIKKIDLARHTLELDHGGKEEFTHLISTMPLDILLGLVNEPSDMHIKPARSRLLCTSVANFNTGFKGTHFSDKHWIYFPEASYPFYRIGFANNFSSTMTPTGCSLLYGECSFLRGSIDHTTRTTMLAHASKSAHQFFGITKEDIITERDLIIDHAYVIYNAWRDTNLPKLLRKLVSCNVHSVGRYGAWKYSSMEDAILDGKSLAEALLAEKGHTHG